MLEQRKMLCEFLRTGNPAIDKEIRDRIMFNTSTNDLAFPLKIMKDTEDKDDVVAALCLEDLFYE